MKIKISNIMLFALASVAIYTLPAYAAPAGISQYSSFTSWLPAVGVAVLLSTIVSGLYYMIGSMLNNQRAKSAGKNEFFQAIATIVFAILIIYLFSLLGTTLQTTSIISPTVTSSICKTLSGSQVNLINSTYKFPGAIPSPTNLVCSQVINSRTFTGKLDYGLGSVYVLSANMTNQTVANLNSFYKYDTFILFLRNFHVFNGFCFPETCFIPFLGAASAEGYSSITISYDYFYGYFFNRSVMPSLAIESTFIFYIFFTQMILVFILLFLWPYLLAAGMILRSNMFTRRAGGTIMAMVVVAMTIYPIIFMFEYSSLSNTASITPIGSNTIPAMTPLCGKVVSGSDSGTLYCYTSANKLQNGIPPTISGPISACAGTFPPSSGSAGTTCYYKRPIDFYVFPKAKDIINLDFYYPQDILPSEMEYAVYFLVPGFSFFGLLSTLFSSAFVGYSLPPNATPFQFKNVGPINAAYTSFGLIHLYGIEAVSGVIIPILNLILTISATMGLSYLLGGDVNIIGLSRFV